MEFNEALTLVRGIKSFMYDNELEYLFNLVKNVAPIRKIVELGCWEGSSTAIICLGTQTRDVTVVDKWCGNIGDLAFENKDKALGNFINNMQRTVGFVPTIIYDNSWDASSRFVDGSVDLLFIDAEHTEECVNRDIINWSPKMKKGSIIVGHDYDPEHRGVMNAVEKQFGNDFKTGAGRMWHKEF